VKYLALAWLCLCLTPVFAQISEELPELEIPAQAEETWEQLFSELREQPLSLAGRADLFSKNPQIHLNGRWQLPRAELLALYNRDLNKDLDAFSFRLAVGSNHWDAVLGNYRLRFGRGLALGTSSRSMPDSLFSFQNPLSPRNYGLLGQGRHIATKPCVPRCSLPCKAAKPSSTPRGASAASKKAGVRNSAAPRKAFWAPQREFHCRASMPGFCAKDWNMIGNS